jgi:hypothetical protein
MRKLFLIMVGLLLASWASRAMAHPGPLDADGGHWEKATNTYHWHQDADGKAFNTPVPGGKEHVLGQKASIKAAEWNKAHPKHKRPKKLDEKKAKKPVAKAAKPEQTGNTTATHT